MVINQGDIYWIDLVDPSGSEPGYLHPHVVIQNNLFNRSQIRTVLVCPLTSNLRRADAPGNVLLAKRETGLPKPSVANVSQIITVDKTQLGEYVSTLSIQRVREIVAGLKLLVEPREVD